MSNFLKKSVVAVPLLTSLLIPVFAQFDEHLDPIGPGNPALKDIKSGFTIPVLKDSDYKASWASSYLDPEGKPPKEPDYDKYNKAASSDEDSDVISEESNTADKYDNWQSMYSAARAQDGDLSTCWAVRGKGLGEVVLVRVDARKPVSINSGFQKSMDLFKKNSRPRVVKVWVLEATHEEATPSAVIDSDVKVVASLEVELHDVFGQQPLAIPKYTPTPITTHPDGTPMDSPLYASFVAIQILTVYPGSKFEDTCISEVTGVETP